jgi:uncharacterized protein YkwD
MAVRCPPRLQVEQLEDRRLLAGGLFFNAPSGLLTIRATPFNDVAQVTAAANQLQVSITGGINQARTFPLASVTSIVFYGNAGNDRFVNNSKLPCAAYGGAGRDTLQGGGGSDLLDGGAGNDTLVSGSGKEVLAGGLGHNSYVHVGPQTTILPGPQDSPLAAGLAALGSLTAGQQLIFQQLNLHRQQAGLPPLTLNPLLLAAAQGHAENMARQDKYGDSGTDGHILDGHDVVYRVRLVGYRFSWLGENVAFNQFYADPAQTLADQWWNSLPHRANMLESRYTEVGIGIATGASGRTYGVEVFGHPA